MAAADVMRELVLPRLDAVKKSGTGFMARCPAHEDGKASLSVSPGRDQPVVLHCHANCDPIDILARLDLTWADLSEPKSRVDDEVWTPAGPATAVYDYRDEHGQLLFQVCRTANKDFRQRVPDATTKSGYRWKLGDVRRVLYRLSQVIEAVTGGEPVYICEGEKDVHTIEAHGLVATCNPGGAGKWREEYTEHFRDAHIWIIADKDEPGQAHARQVRDALLTVTDDIEIVEAADGCKDVTEHIGKGHRIDQLVRIWPSSVKAAPDLAPDLWQFLATEDDEYDWLVPGLLERGDRLMLTGAEGLGKSMLTRQLAVMMAAGVHPFQRVVTFEPRRVLYIDCENSERQSRRKFRKLAAASERARHRVPDGGMRLIHKPNGLDLTKGEDAAWLLERVTAHQPDVLFIGPFYRLHNANMNEELPARRTVAVLDQARNSVGCALVIEAHAGHGNAINERDVRPVGSSLLLRWPEFGYGLALVDKDKKRVHLRPWRGPRDERDWPRQLMWGDPDGWPWDVFLTAEDMKGSS
jgi:hypothetical protein